MEKNELRLECLKLAKSQVQSSRDINEVLEIAKQYENYCNGDTPSAPLGNSIPLPGVKPNDGVKEHKK